MDPHTASPLPLDTMLQDHFSHIAAKKGRSNTIDSSFSQQTCVAESSRSRQPSVYSYSAYPRQRADSATLQPPPSIHRHPHAARNVSSQPSNNSLSAPSFATTQYGGYTSDSTITLDCPPINHFDQDQSKSYQNEPKSYGSGAEPPSLPLAFEDPVHELKIGKAREICFILVVACSHLMTQCGLGQALAPIQYLGNTFGSTRQEDTTWYIAAYSLTVGTFILISGRIGDIVGHKRVFVFGYCWLGMWAAFAGFAAYTKSPVFFDLCRALQGIGPALLMPNGLALFSHAYPPGMKKNIVFSVFGGVAPLGFVIGSLSGSFFAEYVFWPWSFWSYGLAAFFLAITAFFIIPSSLGENLTNRPTFDYKGSVLGVAGLVLVNVAWNQAPSVGWGMPSSYVLLIVGLLCLAAFFYVERTVKDPILPLKVLDSNTGFVLTCVALGWGAFAVWLFYSYRFLMEERMHSPMAVTAQFSPAIVGGLIAAAMTGFLMTHAPVSFVMLVSMLAFLVGTIIGGTAQVSQSYWAQTFLSVCIMPFGMDMSFPAATIILSNHMPREHQGLAASLVNTMVNYSISISLGIAGTVEAYIVRADHGTGSNLHGIRGSFYTSMALSFAAVLVGALYFGKSMGKEGWKVMAH